MFSFRRRLLKAFTHITLYLARFLLVAALILWLLNELWELGIPGLEPVTVMVGGVISWLAGKLGQRASGERQSDKSHEWRNRQQLIQNVRAAWIHGVRDQSLHQSVWIELGLKYEPEQVKRPWHMAWQSSNNQQSLSALCKCVAPDT